MSDPIKLTFMSALKRHRVAKGLTQTELGRKVGVSCAAVSLWESGSVLPKPSLFPKIARVLGVTPLELTQVFQPEETVRR